MFCSNIENLLAYGALKLEVVTEKELEWFEHRMAVLYFMSVLGLLVWFLWPLMERMKERASMSGSAVSSGGVPSQGKDKDKEEDNDKKNGKGKGKDKAE